MVETTGLRFAPSLLSVMVSAFEGRAEGINFEPRLIYIQVRVFYFLLLFGVVQGGMREAFFCRFSCASGDVSGGGGGSTFRRCR